MPVGVNTANSGPQVEYLAMMSLSCIERGLIQYQSALPHAAAGHQLRRRSISIVSWMCMISLSLFIYPTSPSAFLLVLSRSHTAVFRSFVEACTNRSIFLYCYKRLGYIAFVNSSTWKHTTWRIAGEGNVVGGDVVRVQRCKSVAYE